MKKAGNIILIMMGIMLCILVGFYYFFLSPAKRAEAHLAFVHQAIEETHPAALEKDATEFHYWHTQGYEQTKKLLPLVKSEGDANAIMRYYLSGYQDSHMEGYFDRTPYSRIDSQKSTWAGWSIRVTNAGYFVQLAKSGDGYPPKNAQLLSCDQKPIDALLEEEFSPYFDRRWHLLAAQQQAARALTQKYNNVLVLDRPDIKECTFEVDGVKKTYPLNWQLREEKDIAAFKAINNPMYQLPSVKELSAGVLWITASDFQLNSPEAAESQKKLLTQLPLFPNKQIVVFDVRLNSGGNSRHGSNIISNTFENNEKAYLLNEWDKRTQGTDAQFRASWRLYWSWDYALIKVIQNQGAESQQAKILNASLTRLKQALDAGESHFLQSEINGTSQNKKDPTIAMQPTEWQSDIQVVLLTSSRCASACLDFVDMVKLIPNHLHLGEATNADTSYIEVARLQSEYFSETFNFMVPTKKWNKRIREDNKPYIPDIPYHGNIYDDQAVESWVLEQIQQHSKIQ